MLTKGTVTFWPLPMTHSRALMVALVLLIITLQQNLSAADTTTAVETHFKAAHYEEVVDLLSQQTTEPLDYQSRRLLGLAYFRLHQPQPALIRLQQSLAEHPGDPVVQLSLAEILFIRSEPQAALDQIESLPIASPLYGDALLLRGRILIAMEQDEAALKALEEAKRHAPRLIGQATLATIPIYSRLGRLRDAEWKVRLALADIKHPIDRSELLLHLRQLYAARRQADANRKVRAWVRYRLEHDDYLVVDSSDPLVNNSGSAESDWRHVFQVGAGGRQALRKNWGLFGSVDLYQSLHFRLDRFNLQRYMVEGGLNWSRKGYGIRLPLRSHSSRLDNRAYLRTHEFQPSLYRYFQGNLLLSGYLDFKRNDFRFSTVPEESRDGRYRGVGLLAQMPFKQEQGLVYLNAAIGRDRADGSNWDNRRTQLDAVGTYRYRPDLVVNAGYRITWQAFDHRHTLYGKRRDDLGQSLSATLAYSPRREWEWNVGASYTQRNSNIPIYDYDRAILFVGTAWYF